MVKNQAQRSTRWRCQRHGLELLLAESERALVLVAEIDSRVVGMVSVQLVISTAEGKPSALLEDLVVDQSFRGRGIGSKLLLEAATWSARRGASRLRLLADITNENALTFYARLGWHRTSLINLRRHL